MGHEKLVRMLVLLIALALAKQTPNAISKKTPRVARNSVEMCIYGTLFSVGSSRHL